MDNRTSGGIGRALAFGLAEAGAAVGFWQAVHGYVTKSEKPEDRKAGKPESRKMSGRNVRVTRHASLITHYS